MSCVGRKCAERCFYCGADLDGCRHEHDHTPIPKRHGGQDTVPACMECHTLKDRLPLDTHWPLDLMVAALNQCGPLGRIYLAKAFGIAMDRHVGEQERQALLSTSP